MNYDELYVLAFAVKPKFDDRLWNISYDFKISFKFCVIELHAYPYTIDPKIPMNQPVYCDYVKSAEKDTRGHISQRGIYFLVNGWKCPRSVRLSVSK